MGVPTSGLVGTQTEATGPITVAWPTHTTDDIGLLCVQHDASVSGDLTTPRGFTFLAWSSGVGTGTNQTASTMWWCRATSSSMASPVVADNGDHNIGCIITFKGCKTTGDPYDTDVQHTFGSSTTAVSIACPTTTQTDTMNVTLVGGAGLNNAAIKNFGTATAANGTLTNFKLDIDTGSTINNYGGAFSICHGSLATIGSMGTISGTTNGTTYKSWVSIALLSTTSTASSGITSNGNFFRLFGR